MREIYVWAADTGNLKILVPDDATDAEQLEAAQAALDTARKKKASK
jgi:hypothetical protein